MLDLTEDSILFDNLSTVTYTDPNGTVYTVDNVKVYPAANVSAEISDTNVRSVSTKFCMWSNSISVPPQVNGRLVIVSGPMNELIGELLTLDDSGRVRVLLEIMSGKIIVTLNRSTLHPA